MLVIFLVALVVLGPERLPQVARTLGKIMADFRRITGDFRYQIEREMSDLERQAHIRQQSAAATPASAAADASLQAAAEESAYQSALTFSDPLPSSTPEPEPALEDAPAPAAVQKPTNGQYGPA
jgi:sec-independent protein translocase protein TatB